MPSVDCFSKQQETPLWVMDMLDFLNTTLSDMFGKSPTNYRVAITATIPSPRMKRVKEIDLTEPVFYDFTPFSMLEVYAEDPQKTREYMMNRSNKDELKGLRNDTQ